MDMIESARRFRKQMLADKAVLLMLHPKGSTAERKCFVAKTMLCSAERIARASDLKVIIATSAMTCQVREEPCGGTLECFHDSGIVPGSRAKLRLNE